MAKTYNPKLDTLSKPGVLPIATPVSTNPSVSKYVDYANQQVDEQALLDKFNAATVAQYNLQREQNRQAENAFYNQMYNTQQTAVDAIRQANAAAVSTGASRGIQAANELSAILGLQQESVASATELAQANRQTAQEETAAVLENVLNAYQQAEQQRQNIITAGIQAASVDKESEAAQAQAQATNNEALQKALETGLDAYLLEQQRQGLDYKTYSDEGLASLDAAMARIGKDSDGKSIPYAQYVGQITKILDTYGITQQEVADAFIRSKGFDPTTISEIERKILEPYALLQTDIIRSLYQAKATKK